MRAKYAGCLQIRVVFSGRWSREVEESILSLQPAKRARKIEEGRKVPEFPANSVGVVAGSQRLNFDFLAFTSRSFEAVGRKDLKARAAEGEGLISNSGVEFEAAKLARNVEIE
ncbi:hypothetical protein C8J57DRAFT_1224194 [Mycena rebaudengoi]|nr:hypothetical protein C8J57DRAFT_1224194 [Mycena rebaudengoi]